MKIAPLAWWLFAFAVIAVPALAAADGPHLDALSDEEKNQFQWIETAVDNWKGDEPDHQKIKEAIEEIIEDHPNFVPAAVEAARLDWIRISIGFGVVRGSESFLPMFLHLQKQEPSYAKTYVLAANAYINTGDFEGAKPSLAKAEELAPGNPWVDLTWAWMHELKFNRAAAVKSARTGLIKAIGDHRAMSFAVVTIARNGGIPDEASADSLAQTLYDAESDPVRLMEFASRLLGSYHYQPGLLETLALLLARLDADHAVTPERILLEARFGMTSGYIRNFGGTDYAPATGDAIRDILREIENAPHLSEKVWGLYVDLAMNDGDLDQARRLIDDGRLKGYSEALLARKMAAVLYQEGELREVIKLYENQKWMDDDLVMRARTRTGGKEIAKQYYWKQIESDPTSPHNLGDYASFLLFYFSDIEGAIHYARRAYELMPYPGVQNTLSMALLSASGYSVRKGHLDEGLRLFEEASKVGYDEDYVRQFCYMLCEETQAALTAFR